MSDKISVNKKDILEVLSDLNWIDVYLFKLGTELGARDANKSEIADALLHFFSKNDLGNKIGQIKSQLRNEIEAAFIENGDEINEIDAKLDTDLDKNIPSLK